MREDCAPMTEHDVWIVASGLLALFGSHPGDHTIDQIMDYPGAPQTVEDWHRVSAAIDAITAATKQ
jgi:hypothetical protein